jgi:hypothetical protein
MTFEVSQYKEEKYRNRHKRSRFCRCHCSFAGRRQIHLPHSLPHSWGNCAQCDQFCRLHIRIKSLKMDTFVTIRASTSHSALGRTSVLLRTFPRKVTSFAATIASFALWRFRTISGKMTSFCYRKFKLAQDQEKARPISQRKRGNQQAHPLRHTGIKG